MGSRKAVGWRWSLLFVLLAACSSPDDGLGRQRVATPAVGSPAPAADGTASPGDSAPDRRSRGEEAAAASPRPAPGRSPGGDSPGSLGPPASYGPRPAVGSAFRADPSGDGDREGSPPAYADIRRATLKGTRRMLTLTLRVDGPIERSLPEGSDMTANFRLERRGGRDHQIYVIGTSSGWEADLDNTGSFPGRFALAGDRFVFQLSWSRLGGPARLRWEAETAWTRTPSGPLGQTEFAFDRVPEYEPASYPE